MKTMQYLGQRTLLGFAVLLLFSSSSKAARSWKTRHSMLTARNNLVSGVVNGKIYAIGGDGMTTNEEYEPVSNSWTTKAPMPTTRYWGFAAGTVAGKIYAIGGAEGGFYLSTNEEYEPSTDSWAAKSDMPTERFGLAIGVVGNKIYAIGGYNSTGVLSTNEEYDPVADSWATKAPMPTARYYLTASVAGNKIYLIGGYNSGIGGYVSIVEEYDPATDTWTSRSSMPTVRGELASESINDTIYAVGGWNGATDLATAEVYVPASNIWQAYPPMPTARSGLACASILDSLYAIGGLLGFSYLATNEQYSPDPTNIEIPSFYARAGNSYVKIHWEMPSENGYEVYKILRKSASNYAQIAVVPAKGNSPSSQSYSYKDRNVNPGNKYEYKLGVVKTDGSTKWYGPVSASIPGVKTFLGITPNPFRDKVEIRYKISEITKLENRNFPISQFPISLCIYDISGRVVKNFALSNFQFPLSEVTWDGRDDAGRALPSGIYFCNLKVNASVERRRITLLK